MRVTSKRPNELELVQNPALGAFALWNFVSVYQVAAAGGVPLPLAFLVLPLVLHEPTRLQISSTRLDSGLPVFVSKLGERREDLLAVHRRAFRLRELTMDSIEVAIGAGLLAMLPRTASLHAALDDLPNTAPHIPERIKWLGPTSQKLGHWLAAVDVVYAARTLRVDF